MSQADIELIAPGDSLQIYDYSCKTIVGPW
jgi:hypothetical protein